MQTYKLTNKGKGRLFRLRNGFIFLKSGMTIDIGKGDTQNLAKVSDVKIDGPKPLDLPELESILEFSSSESLIDYSRYRIQELRSIASKVGIEGFFTMRKTELIKNLEEMA